MQKESEKSRYSYPVRFLFKQLTCKVLHPCDLTLLHTNYRIDKYLTEVTEHFDKTCAEMSKLLSNHERIGK